MTPGLWKAEAGRVQVQAHLWPGRDLDMIHLAIKIKELECDPVLKSKMPKQLLVSRQPSLVQMPSFLQNVCDGPLPPVLLT